MDRIRWRSWPMVAVALAWAGVAAVAVQALAVERAVRAADRPELSNLDGGEGFIFPVAILGSGVVGSALALRRPRMPAGWLFLALALAISFGGATGSYATYGAVLHPGSLPGSRLAAVYADGVFVAWVCLLAVILLITPTGSAPSPGWRSVGWAAVASGVVFFLAITFRSEPLDTPPFKGMTSPLAREPYGGIASSVALAAVIAAHLALLASIASLVVRARRAGTDERRQLSWLLVPAIPFPFLVAGSWVAAAAGNDFALTILGGGYLVIIPVAAGLAIEKQRLYDVDRIISRTVAYTLLSVLVVGAYIAIVVSAGITGGRAAGTSVPLAVMATLAAVTLGGVTRTWLQNAVDRRFNRRSFAALEQVRRYVHSPGPETTVEEALRVASGDPSLAVAYWSDDRAAWVREDGTPAAPSAHGYELLRPGGAPSARIDFDHARVAPDLLQALAAEARPELENARLRAAISLQLVEVRESRSRIVAAQLEERRRIERDLHDGSQQRLLALAMNLRATELSGDSEAALKVLPRAVDEIQATVRELRELANGLFPGTLEDGGLSAAFQELAARAPIPIQLRVLEKRLPPAVESSAWFIACEAIANVVKHAAASAVSLAAAEEGGMLVLSIDDDGIGGADVRGHGLRGMADRAETAGGRLSVGRGPLGGTTIRAVLPCES